VQVTFEYEWQILEGSPFLLFSDPSSPSAEITIPTGSSGRWLLRLGVTDGFSVACCDVVVERAEPFDVNAGPDQVINQVGAGSTEVQLDGTVSGLTTVLSWQQIGGDTAYFEPHAGVADPKVILPPTGTDFLFRVSATDFFGNSASDTVTITRNITP
jgi:hypothetical protein